jgi:hypothetical protein
VTGEVAGAQGGVDRELVDHRAPGDAHEVTSGLHPPDGAAIDERAVARPQVGGDHDEIGVGQEARQFEAPHAEPLLGLGLPDRVVVGHADVKGQGTSGDREAGRPEPDQPQRRVTELPPEQVRRVPPP